MLLVLFFFKQKTAYEMRISDWSSDVCSSDLLFRLEPPHQEERPRPDRRRPPRPLRPRRPEVPAVRLAAAVMSPSPAPRASPPRRCPADRKSLITSVNTRPAMAIRT